MESLVEQLIELNPVDSQEYKNFENVQGNGTTLTEIARKVEYDLENILPDVSSHIEEQCLPDNITPEWKYVCLNLHILKLLSKKLEENSLISVQDSKKITRSLNRFSTITISRNLPPFYPYHTKIANLPVTDVLNGFNILRLTTLSLIDLMQNPDLKYLIVSSCISKIVSSVYHMTFTKIKPDPTNKLMSREAYEALISNEAKYYNVLLNLKKTLHPKIFIRENIQLYQKRDSPRWFQRKIGVILCDIIRGEKGVVQIASALLDCTENDSTKIQESVQIIAKIIISLRRGGDFESNICRQLFEILDLIRTRPSSTSTSEVQVYEQMFAMCVRLLYETERGLCEQLFIPKLFHIFSKLCDKSSDFSDNEDITGYLNQTVRLFNYCFILNTVTGTSTGSSFPCLPVQLISSIVIPLFRILTLINGSSLVTLNNDISELIREYIKSEVDYVTLFDAFLFQEIGTRVDISEKLYLNINADKIIVKLSEYKILYPVEDAANTLDQIMANDSKMLSKLFTYYLSCLSRDKYVKMSKNFELLGDERDLLNSFEPALVIYRNLWKLSENKSVQKIIIENPDDIINYIEVALKKFTKSKKHHRIKNPESEDFQITFTIIMILQSMVNHSKENHLSRYKKLTAILLQISNESVNEEMKNLTLEVLKVLRNDRSDKLCDPLEKSELDQALEDICDPLLPVRGHALIALGKLIEKKDKNALEKKQYILNIFQQNLSSDDSYIYLTAIGGLAAMADIFTDTILNTLCEEFSDFSKKNSDDDGQETRLKLGEILVRTCKILGEMAPKYKALLLNTFLNGTKDDDHLVRASSLSNLGEICRVLGYKIESTLTEILVCVHAVISTDKSVEARRAAVTVLRQLFTGLGRDVIAVMKEEILPVYRTLKHVYNNDSDDVMRLQAQLALEELNEGMKDFVFPQPKLSTEKKIIMLN